MYLKRIELSGFKSFCSKTKISLEPGISCIVGPNGSGKSNIADAVRWVLGESSARNIRGDKMEDVIFSGSGKRRALGMAEVTLFLDNSDGYLPLAFSEISVSRRAIRNGGSEYFINNAPCRLKDIRELFTDTGIGVDGLSLINQGRIHELISARPEERRALVEEAAGIIKYRDRKREAVRKLAETERHLERVGDIIHELGGRLEPLRVQAETAQAFLLRKEEADRLEIGISVKVLSEAEEKISAFEAQISSQEEALLREESSRLQIAAEAEALRLAISAMDEQVSAANENFHQLQTSREQAEGERKLALSKQQHNQAEQARLQKELEQTCQALAAKEQAAAELEAHIARTEAELAQQRQLVEDGGSEDLQQRLATLALEKEQSNQRWADCMQQLGEAKAQLELKSTLSARSDEALAKLSDEQEQLQQQQLELAGQQQLLEAVLADLEAQNKQQLAKNNELELELNKQRERSQDLAASEAEAKFHCHSLQTRVSMLTELASSYEGYFPGVKGLLAAKQQGQAPAGLLGVVAELMTVPSQFQVAIEAYLGANIQNIVAVDAAAAKAAVAYLKAHKLGRATFLPLDILKRKEKEDFSAVLQQKGVYGRASELVQVDAVVQPAIDFLLNQVLLVEDMDTALQAAKQLKYRVSVVTLEGDLVAPGAAISGGSRNHKAGALLSQKAKLTDAQQELATAQQALEKISKELNQARAALQQTNQAQEQVGLVLQQISKEREAHNRDWQQNDFRAESLLQRLAAIAQEMQTIHGQLAFQEEEYAEAEGHLAQLTAEERQLSEKLLLLNEDLSALEELVAHSQAEMTEKKVAQAASEQKLRGQGISLQKIQADRNDLAWEAEEKNADLQAAEKEAAACLELIASQDQLLKEIGLALADAEAQLEQAQHGMAADSGRLLDLEKQEKALLHSREALQTEIHQLQLRRERWQADFENEAAKLQETFALSLAEAKFKLGETPARTVMISRLAQLKREIAALGNVNLAAIEEYGEVSERYQFLTSQRADLNEAKDKLHRVIHEMDTTMSSRFREAFVQLSEAFHHSFSRLFEGGQAALVMSDPEHVLETGVELRVSLPGKKVSNYNLLSGGEKSLVGIALMFAMLTVRPTPFCVMDEVDAALDEANIDRFTAYLRDKAQSSQFVMISHRQTTMEAANMLWGVTMAEEGISKVISVRLTESGGAEAVS